MKIILQEHYQSMAVRLSPGVHEVNPTLGQYLVDNGYATREVENIPPVQELVSEELVLEVTVAEDAPTEEPVQEPVITPSEELALEVDVPEDTPAPEPVQEPVTKPKRK